jgi:protein SCO1
MRSLRASAFALAAVAALLALPATSQSNQGVPGETIKTRDTSHGGHAYAPPPTGDLAGELTLRTVDGAPFSFETLRGRPAMIYFGYSRCGTSCPVGLHVMAAAVDLLEADGVAVNAVFVDFEAPAISQPRLRRPHAPSAPAGQAIAAASRAESDHGAHPDSSEALRRTAKQFEGRIQVLTGSRAELHRAAASFAVRREHIPPRAGEVGHSINHTTYIYLMDPFGRVVDHRYHDVSAKDLAAATNAARTARRLHKSH